MTRLSELLPFNQRETVASYCSRLAAACGYRHARSFGADLGFSFQGLAIGNEEDIDTFSRLVDRSSASLSAGVVTTVGRMNEIAGHKLSRGLMQRQRLRYCPCCVGDDERGQAGRFGHRAFGRIEWLVNAVRTCTAHNVMIVTSEIVPPPMFLHDFAANLANETTGDAGIVIPQAMEPDSLQRHVEARLRSATTTSAWLDSMPLHVAIRLCETVGASERNGLRFRSDRIDPIEWSACAGAGYDLLCGGEADFRGWLEKLLSDFALGQSDMGGRVLFGRLYERLAHETDDPAFDPVRDIMRDVALGSLPLGPGDDFFGPVRYRRLHSVQSASRQFGIHPKRLRKLLVNSGMIPAKDVAKTFERILLPAADMEKFVAEAQAGLDVPEAKIRLGVSRIQFDILVEHRLIVPVAGDRWASELVSVDRRFAPDDLDDLLARLRESVTMEPWSEMVDIAVACRRTNCQFMEVMEMLLNRSLKKVAIEPGHQGISGFRLEVDEVRRMTAGEDHGCYAISDLQSLIPASSRIVSGLLSDGWIATVERRNPAKRYMQKVVEPETLAKFKEEFISLGNLASSRRTRTWSLKRQLEERSIEPKFIVAEMPFYRRADLTDL
ncbi:TniQ family protein [Agrobacterium salinitolerans]|uniref:TniQ family protein n=1 Tax=Agrobacterium salinitolerans TaxID=1183413 RepID=UPI0022B854DE|nr:TniQ family protein [Agrobacterium salinitolerans]MCZ7854827.1 TniQ family protein [Agrobacterium salinitolerans]MCZ7977135.1 TniQ family protein [Agrobacterium salinitolerans]